MKTETTATVGFVIAYYDDGREWQREYLEQTLESVLEQDDPNWRLYVVNDASPEPTTRAYVDQLVASLDARATAIHAEENGGCGPARNRALPYAAGDGCEIIAWLDADDLAHPSRVAELRQMFGADPDLDVIYNSITFIDEKGTPWSDEELLPSLRLLAAEQNMPALRGFDRWIDVAVDRENVAIPSGMSARIELAQKHPFPEVRFCEDVATWFRFLGSGAKVDHGERSTLRYRVPRVGGSASRELAGDLEYFNRLRCDNERAGLVDAIAMARDRKVVGDDESSAILSRYLMRIGRTVLIDGHRELASRQFADSMDVSYKTFREFAAPSEIEMAEAYKAKTNGA